MNHTKWWVPPKAIVWVVGAFLAGTAVISAFPSAVEVLALQLIRGPVANAA
jgi:hypothetical protein